MPHEQRQPPGPDCQGNACPWNIGLGGLAKRDNSGHFR